ncbi:MoaD/ThiS family protein [Actinokineospora auranticolor]|uniref:Molybdopterin converting factor small subunit n=1 Tax=Actinokineospora auranticolor TaxID=155976 RepID=A0A2S6GGE0_9PSEU|nr:MoaD/ThiS family protein [Actinokineospora auranticolor]PPK64287.1 molybdopterin converting factor small subunit [Actinokineospora auranticolor]
MPVTVVLPAALHPRAGGRTTLEVDIPAPTTLNDILDVIAARYPDLSRRIRDETGALRRHVNFFIDGEESRRLGGGDAPITPDTRIELIPSVAGG